MIGLILAGGKGTRLRPITHFTPKPVVPVAGRPFLEYQIDLLRSYGIREIIICLSYMADKIKRQIGDGGRWGVKIEYCEEEIPLGTAGAIKNAEPLIAGRICVALNGDVLTDADISALVRFHRSKEALATLTLVEVADPTAYGLVITGHDGRVTKFVEKPGWEEAVAATVNAGIYVLEPEVIAGIPVGREISMERETYPGLLAQDKPVYGWVSRGYWLDIGTLRKFRQANIDVLAGKMKTHLGSEVSGGLDIGSGASISRNAVLVPPVVLGKRVTVGDGAVVGPSTVLGDDCVVMNGAKVARSILMTGCLVGSNAEVTDCIIDQRTRIWDDCLIAGGVLSAGSVIGRGTTLGVQI